MYDIRQRSMLDGRLLGSPNEQAGAACGSGAPDSIESDSPVRRKTDRKIILLFVIIRVLKKSAENIHCIETQISHDVSKCPFLFAVPNESASVLTSYYSIWYLRG